VGDAGQEWGEGNDAKLAHAQEANRYRRFRQQFQLLVLLLLLPLFSFVLGKLDNAESR
jgi:hypothetical protein